MKPTIQLIRHLGNSTVGRKLLATPIIGPLANKTYRTIRLNQYSDIIVERGDTLSVEFPFGTVHYRLESSDSSFAPEDFEFITYLVDSLPDDPVIYDIGAHVGHHTVPYSLVADHVVAIEPLRVNRDRLYTNVKLNDCSNCDIHSLVLCDTNGSVRMEVEAALSSEEEPDPRAGLMKGGETTTLNVKSARLDDFVRENEVPAPDGIKIDVEGAEHDVITGGIETLRSHGPDLFLEVHTNKLHMYETSATALHETLIELGYAQPNPIRAGTPDREWLHYRYD